ncbi:MAG: COX15/CtaA family protein [Crocinitomicaceae bacterium]|nr:COX15/CtaA family protein [Crocinitomicaceae bacterium]
MQRVENFTKHDRQVFNWLMTGVIMIIMIVVIGGITRLTQSGLSMVKWEPIMGTLPPLNDQQWNEAFELYQGSPEFHHYNNYFALSDFKAIYFWEYLHRLIARIIGLVFIIPCIVFWIRKDFTAKTKRKVLIIFGLGTLQAVLGWVMVKSGLVDQPHVSHYRLAAHLITALGLMAYIYWVAMGLKYIVETRRKSKALRWIKWLLAGIVLQIIYGAFVAGLKAGLMYNTFPKMGTEWYPENFTRILNRQGWMSWMESGGMVQFVHRMLALTILLFSIIFWIKFRKANFSVIQQALSNFFMATILLQVILGIYTLIFAVPVELGVLHQFGAIIVLLSATTLAFSLRGKNKRDSHENI